MLYTLRHKLLVLDSAFLYLKTQKNKGTTAKKFTPRHSGLPPKKRKERKECKGVIEHDHGTMAPKLMWTAVAAAGTYALRIFYSKDQTVMQLAKAFVGLWTAQFLVWFSFMAFVYPHVFSPMRNLPTAKGKHWLLGHGLTILRSEIGKPLRKWYVFVSWCS